MQILITMKPVECLTMIVLQVLTTAKSIKACRWPLPRRPAEVQQSCFEYRKTCRFSNICFEYCNACWGHVEVLQAGFDCPISCWRTRYSASLFWLPQYMLNAVIHVLHTAKLVQCCGRWSYTFSLVPGAREKRRSAWTRCLRMRLISPKCGKSGLFSGSSVSCDARVQTRYSKFVRIMAYNESLDFQQAISHTLQRLHYDSPNFELSACTSHKLDSVNRHHRSTSYPTALRPKSFLASKQCYCMVVSCPDPALSRGKKGMVTFGWFRGLH